MEAVARFKLHVRCRGCKKVSGHRLSVPDADDAPRDVDELLASAFLQRQRLKCTQCLSYEVQLMGATQLEADAA